MSYKIAFTVEKVGENILDVLHNHSSWPNVEACFPPDSPFATVELFVSEDNSYVEYVATFADEEIYQLWHEAHESLHDESRAALIVTLESQGATVNRYYTPVDLSAPGALPFENFISRKPA